MAIDTTLFMADIPAGTYTVGQIIPLTVKAGPSAVRQGYGTPILKEINTGFVNHSTVVVNAFEFVVQNSNFIDPIINGPSSLGSLLGLDPQAKGVQSGNNCQLEPNSTWTVYAKVIQPVTTTAAYSLFTTIDIDYSAVGSVVDPQAEDGIPTSIEYAIPGNVNADGASSAALWDVVNVDSFKPGFKYLLQRSSIHGAATAGFSGFIAFANAAAMSGLSRIIPVGSAASSLCKHIKYASAETKGPMDIKVMMFAATASVETFGIVADYVKRNL